MIVLRRMTLLITLMFWQGGFMFYGAVVVPVGAEVLGSHREQGRITRPVTNYTHGAGAVSLAVWCWEVAAQRARGRRLQLSLATVLLVALGVQVWLHAWLEDVLDLEPFDQARFRVVHQWYLIISTAQWLAALVLLALTLRTWQLSAASRGDCDSETPSYPTADG